jgi:cytochrome b561
MTLLLLAVVRLAWRLTHQPPADVAMPVWQARAAHAMHGLMYALFFAVPLVGWAMSSAHGYPVVWFGVLPLPDWVPKDEALAHQLEDLHAALAWALAALVVAHVAAALKHQFIDKDGLLDRMRFGRG